MNCPKCDAPLRQSKKNPEYGLCDNCKKKFKLPAPDTSDVTEGQKYSNIPPKHVRHAREKELKKNYQDMLSIEDNPEQTFLEPEADNDSPRSRKGIGIVILIIILLLIAGGVFFCYKTGIASDIITRITGEKPSTSSKGNEKDFKTSTFTLSYTDYAMSIDYEGNECLVVYYEFTNNGENSTNAGYEVSINAEQNEVTCEATSLITSDQAVDNLYMDVAPGASLKIGRAFKLTDKSTVTLEATDLLNKSDATATQKINLK